MCIVLSFHQKQKKIFFPLNAGSWLEAVQLPIHYHSKKPATSHLHHTKPFLLFRSPRSVLIRDFSGWSAFGGFLSWLSKLFLAISEQLHALCSSSAALISDWPLSSSLVGGLVSFRLLLAALSFWVAETNFLRCLMYSGYSSRLQWPPLFSQRGSNFCLLSSQSCFPCEQSTTSSEVPCNKIGGL